MWSPMSSKFAAAFALTTLVCVSIRGGLKKEKVGSLVLDHVDKIILFATTYRVPKAMSKKSVRETMLWTIYWSHAAVTAGEEKKLFSLEEPHNLFFSGILCIPWEKSGKEKGACVGFCYDASARCPASY